MNQTNSKEILDLSGISFSSITAVEKRTDADVIKNLIPNLRAILQKRFKNEPVKQELEKHEVNTNGEQRINFACPYCGDSHKNPYKKRGNIYIPGYDFHCYNCRTHTNLETFLSDFGLTLDPADKIFTHNSRAIAQKDLVSTGTLDFSMFMDFDMLDTFAVEKKEIMMALNLVSINHKDAWWIRKYLSERLQTKFKNFAWDASRNRLIIFNYLPSGKVIGFQARNFRSSPKYVTYTISMIYEILKRERPVAENYDEIVKLSFLFGLSTMTTENPITVFEGPLDSFLVENGMSVCGIENSFPLDVPHRYLLDRDTEGLRKSLEILNKGGEVFLWSKFLKEERIRIKSKKIDLNDVFIYCDSHKMKRPDINKYFSSSKYDMIYV